MRQRLRIVKDEAASRAEGMDIYKTAVSGRQVRFIDGQWYACTSNGTPEEVIPAVQIVEIAKHISCF